MNNLVTKIRIKRICNSLIQAIVGKRYVFTRHMNYLPEEIRIQKTVSFVRTAALELNAYKINSKKIRGDVAELGVYQGEFAKEINRVFPNRDLYLFDTFEGFDCRDIENEIHMGYDGREQNFTKTSPEIVLSIMPHRERCIIKRGWFPETTNGLEEKRFVFVSIDADLYDPIYEGLTWFYPRLEVGGMIFVHDYNNRLYKGASKAVNRFSYERSLPFFCLPDECGTAVFLK